MDFLIGIIVGLLLPIQTSVNSKFRFKVVSPYLASMVSMVTGMIFVILLALILGQSPFLPFRIFLTGHWWLFLGGVMGSIAFTINVLLLPHLGAVQTVIMPLLGQIIMSMLIDNFGLFKLPVHRFDLIRMIGILILLAGVLMIIYQKNNRSKNTSEVKKLPWQALGILAGFALATQTSSNGALGRFVSSPIKAANFSFISGSIILVVAVGIFQHNFNQLKLATGRRNRWWIWLGGPLGATYALTNLILAPIIGAGTTIVLTILGNMIGSIVIDKYGWLDTPKRPIGLRHYLGLIVIIIGVVMVRLF